MFEVLRAACDYALGLYHAHADSHTASWYAGGMGRWQQKVDVLPADLDNAGRDAAMRECFGPQPVETCEGCAMYLLGMAVVLCDEDGPVGELEAAAG